MTFEEFEATLDGERLELWLKKIKPKIRVEGECWIWTGRLHNSHPVMNGRNTAYGSVRRALAPVSPEKKRLISSCGFRLCVSPQHTGHGRYKATHCLYGHERKNGHCPTCHLARVRRDRQNNPEKYQQYEKTRRWKQTLEDSRNLATGLPAFNRDKERARGKAYREANQERIQAYRKANRDKMLVYLKNYHKANREKKREYDRARNKAYREANRDKMRAYFKIRDRARAARKKIRKWVLIALLNHYSNNEDMSGSAQQRHIIA